MIGSSPSPSAGPESSPQAGILYAILALQNGLLKRDHLLEAVEAWGKDKRLSLVDILVSKQLLNDDKRKLMDALFAHYIASHEGDVERSLAGLSSLGSVRRELVDMQDDDIAQSLAVIGSGDVAARGFSTIASPPVSEAGGIVTQTRLRIVRPHARGGLGEVSVALDEILHREVALKEIQSKLADECESRERFIFEAEITGRLEHPGIVPVYGVGNYADGRPFYSMRFIKGQNLKDAINQYHGADWTTQPPGEQSLALRNLLGRLVDVCNAVSFAHSRGVLHRDLKPGNVMLGEFGETLVVDWGIAKGFGYSDDSANTNDPMHLSRRSRTSGSETGLGTVIGTPQFMSPEQAAGRLGELGPATDVYALGAILYYLLTDQAPIRRDKDVRRMLDDVINGNWERPSVVNSRVPRPLEAICVKAMALKVDDRYSSVRSLAEEVERYLADERVSAHIEVWSHRARRWLRKHPRLTGGLAATLLAGIVGAIVIVGIQHSNNHRLAELASRNERTLQFLVNAFRRPDPSIEGRSVTVASVLETALREVLDPPVNLAMDDTARAALAHAMGQTFLGLGVYDAASEANRFAWRTRRKTLGDEDPDTVASLNNLATSLMSSGQWQDGYPLARKVLAMQQRIALTDKRALLEAMSNLAGQMYASGDRKGALTKLEQVLELRRAAFGNKDPQTLTSMLSLASAQVATGNAAQAAALAKDVNQILGDGGNPSNAELMITTRSIMASAYKALGQYRSAVSMLQQVVAARRQSLGPEHRSTLIATNNLARAYQAMGEVDKAIEIYRETLRYQKENESLGPNHPDTLSTTSNLANALAAAGKFQEALPLVESAIAARRERQELGDPDALLSFNTLACVFLGLGRIDESIDLHKATLKKQLAALSPQHWDVLLSMHNLAVAEMAAGNLAAARSMLHQTLEMRREFLGAQHPDTRETMRQMAMFLLMVGEYPEAEACVRLLCDLLSEQKELRPQEMGASELVLAEALFEQNRLEDAIGVASAARKHLAQTSVEYDRCGLLLALVQALLEGDDAKNVQLADSYAKLRSHLSQLRPHDRWIVRRACERMIDLYLSQGDELHVAEFRKALTDIDATINKAMSDSESTQAVPETAADAAGVLSD